MKRCNLVDDEIKILKNISTKQIIVKREPIQWITKLSINIGKEKKT